MKSVYFLRSPNSRYLKPLSKADLCFKLDNKVFSQLQHTLIHLRRWSLPAYQVSTWASLYTSSNKTKSASSRATSQTSRLWRNIIAPCRQILHKLATCKAAAVPAAITIRATTKRNNSGTTWGSITTPGEETNTARSALLQASWAPTCPDTGSPTHSHRRSGSEAHTKRRDSRRWMKRWWVGKLRMATCMRRPHRHTTQANDTSRPCRERRLPSRSSTRSSYETKIHWRPPTWTTMKTRE